MGREQGKRDGQRKFHAHAGMNFGEGAAQARGQNLPQDNGAGEEDNGLARDNGNGAEVNRACADDGRHDGQNDEADHVVNDGRAQHNLRLWRLQLAQIAEDASGNAYRGCGQGRSDEKISG